MTHTIAYSALLKAPVNVTWEITRRCNLQCRHCLSADLMEKCNSELTLDQAKGLIDEMDRMEIFQINFGGGEPFLREDFLDILDYAHRKGITTCVSTNGTLLTAQLAKELAAMELLYVQVSLDGGTAATNDPIRGTGTFDRASEGVRLLLRHGFKNLSTNTVVTGINFKEIPLIYALGKRYGTKTRLSRFRPSGNAKEVWQEYHLNKDQLAELSEFLRAHRDILTGDSFFSITAQGRRELGLNMCGAAKMTCAVLPDGAVFPCAFLQDPIFKAGNVVAESMESIWLHAPLFNMIRSIRVESCETCTRFDSCHGGCPAVAYFLAGSLSRPDPECVKSFQKPLLEQETINEVPCHAGTV